MASRSQRVPDFIKNQVYTEENANELVDMMKVRIESRLAGEMGYRDWFGIAGDYHKMLVDGGFATIGIEGLAEAIDRTFKWMLEHYKDLSGSASTGSPVMVHRITII